MALWKKSIEAHQVALVAAAIALDLDWDGDRPTLKSQDRWLKFSDFLTDDNSTNANAATLDSEQVYFQVFMMECALSCARTKNVGLSRTILEAWDYYLRELPAKHGRTDFEYKAWLDRREEYQDVWNTAIDRVEPNPERMNNPALQLARHLCERACGKEYPAIVPMEICLHTMDKVLGFSKPISRRIVDRE